MPYDTQLIAPDLLALAEETTTALGPEWTVTGLLGTAILTHPLGLRCSLQTRNGLLSVSAFVAGGDPSRSAKPFTETIAVKTATGGTVAELIHGRVLPRFGRRDAIAALRLLSLPLRDARLPAMAQGTPERSELVLHADGSTTPVLTVRMRSPRLGAVSVFVRLTQLTADRVIRCERASRLPAPRSAEDRSRFAPDVLAVMDAIPELGGAALPLAGFTTLYRSESGAVITHDENAINAGARFSVEVGGSSPAKAYAVLRAYAAE
ncbi:hypothetical protein [Streptomyces sp. NPDC055099]